MSNALLASLSPGDAAPIQPHLKSIDLEHKRILYEAGATACLTKDQELDDIVEALKRAANGAG